MSNIEQLIADAKKNEAKTIYDMHKASCGCENEVDCDCPEEWDTVTLLHGGSAKAVVSGKTLTLYYTDGTVSTYTEQS
jgi:hypothetical protein